MSDTTTSTYERIVELERAGMSRSAAFVQLAEREGVSKGAISQRYYVAAKAAGATAPPATPKAVRRAASTNGAGDLGTLLETASLMVLEAAREMRELERDAARWRQVAAMADGDA